MKVNIVYIYPANDGEQHTEFALRFICSYHESPPGAAHNTIVVLNGAKQNNVCRCMFSTLPNLTFLEHDDSGWDIGGYQKAAALYPCDFMVFFGGTSYLNGPGWLRRMMDAYVQHGDAIYGTMGNRGDLSVKVHPHIRTTGFWLPPKFMNAYPKRITRKEERYEFEHGKNNLTAWMQRQGKQAWVITWTKHSLWKDWDDLRGGFLGDQTDLLVKDRLCDQIRPRNLVTDGQDRLILPQSAVQRDTATVA